MDEIRQEDLFRYETGREFLHQVLGVDGWETTPIHSEYSSYNGRYRKFPVGTLSEATEAYIKNSESGVEQRICRISRYLTSEEGIPIIQEIIRYSKKRD